MCMKQSNEAARRVARTRRGACSRFKCVCVRVPTKITNAPFQVDGMGQSCLPSIVSHECSTRIIYQKMRRVQWTQRHSDTAALRFYTNSISFMMLI